MNRVIQNHEDADFEKFEYSQVYAGGNSSLSGPGVTVTINGTELYMIRGTTIDILLTSISSASNTLYVLGAKKILVPKTINE